MIKYLKENGHPMTITLRTSVEEDLDGEYYKTVVTDENEKIIAEFVHHILRGRLQWVDGFFAGLTYKNNEVKG